MAPKRKGRAKSEQTQFLLSLLGRQVVVPFDHIPGGIQDEGQDGQTPYGVVGHVREIDKAHPRCVIVRLKGDSRKFFFPAVVVAEWLASELDSDGCCLATLGASGDLAEPSGAVEAQQTAPKHHATASQQQESHSLEELADAAMTLSREEEQAPVHGSFDTSSAEDAATSTVQCQGGPEQGMAAGHDQEQELQPEATLGLGEVDEHMEDMQDMQAAPEHNQEPYEDGSPHADSMHKRQKRSSDEPYATAMQQDEGYPTVDWQFQHHHPHAPHHEPASPAALPTHSQPPSPSPALALSEQPPEQQQPPQRKPPSTFLFMMTPHGLVPVSSPDGPPTHFFHHMLYKGEADLQQDQMAGYGHAIDAGHVQPQLSHGTAGTGHQGPAEAGHGMAWQPSGQPQGGQPQRSGQQGAGLPPVPVKGHSSNVGRVPEGEVQHAQSGAPRPVSLHATRPTSSLTLPPAAPRPAGTTSLHSDRPGGVKPLSAAHGGSRLQGGLSAGRPATSHPPAQQQQQRQPAKPARKWTKPGRGYTTKKSVADILGLTVEIPGPIFGVDVPDVYYRGKILSNDTDHADAVVIRMQEDKAKWYFPAGQVREWLEDAALRHAEQGEVDVDHTTGRLADSFAAEVLTQMSAGQTTSHGSQVCSRQRAAAAHGSGMDGVGECTQALGGQQQHLGRSVAAM